MKLDPELQKLLLDTFQVELEEQLQLMTDSLLAMEEQLTTDERQPVLEAAFRAAHNIKGAARGVDVLNIVEISHHLETLLSGLKQEGVQPDQQQVDISLEAIDRMRESMAAFQKDGDIDFDLADLKQRLELAAQSDIAANNAVKQGSDATVQQPAAQAEAPASAPLQVPVSMADAAEPEATPATDSKKETIRVTADKLDQVGALAEELQITKIEIDDHFSVIRGLRDSSDNLARMWARAMRQVKNSELEALPNNLRQLFTGSADTVAEMNEILRHSYVQVRNTANNLGFLSTSLQSDVRTLRMVPASTIIRPLARTVRNIARELGKELHFDIIGDELEIDRIVLQGINDPLVHLLRNAIDHGLENPAQRVAAGKPEKGRMILVIRNEGSHAVIEVQDDGRGIDADKVAKIAVSKGLLNASAVGELSDREKLDFIFRPGFSTKEIITDISGRGVGLDVVQTNLRNLKGTLSVDTEMGEGTTFILKIPFTMSAEHGLVVRAAGKSYAIPITALERVIELEHSDIIDVEASQAIMYNEQPVPLRELAVALGETQSELPERQFIPVIIVSRGRRSVALVVDEIEGEREIVIKPLRPPIMSVPNVAGATVTGTGEVIMVLDAGNLVDTALQSASKLRNLASTQDRDFREQPKVLVVDDSITTRTLERNILEARGYDVTVATDGKQGWETVQNKQFDLVITDVEMPVMNGFELAQHIKQSAEHSDIPVIIVTSLASDEDKQRGIDVGADAYVVKSQFETTKLLEIVQQLV